MDAPRPVALAYADRTAARPLAAARRTIAGRVVLACWLLPLVAGAAIFAASEVVRATAPPGVQMMPSHGGPPASPAFFRLSGWGLLTLGIGTVLAGIGAAAVLTFVLTRWSAAVDRWRQVVRPALVMAGLLASNFVSAAVLTFCALR